jgi:hypothetical protein
MPRRESRNLVNACWLLCGGIGTFGLGFTDSPVLWTACVLCLPLALELAGGREIKPIVAACLGLFWMAIFSGVLSADFNSQSLDNIPSEFAAIVYSLVALFAIAIGYRIGARLFDARAAAEYEVYFNTRKLLIAYWCSFVVAAGLSAIASLVPSLTQPILALRGIELLLLYIFSAQIFATRTHYIWLLAAVVADVALGATSYSASYQIPLIVVLAAALNSHSVQLRFSQIMLAAMVGLALFSVSLVWSAIKPEYRFWLATEDPHVTEQISARIEWILDRVTSGSVNFTDAAIKLTNRIGYTHFYGVALPRMESPSYQSTSYWAEAVGNVLKPRFLFPDKPVLDDTRITTEMTGVQFGESVSVSVGFVAQAHSDFGFPLMYGPLALVGMALGALGAYFQSRKASKFARDGFMAAALVFKFTYESNIDKAVGGLALSSLALVLTFQLVYPTFERWASDRT